MIGHRTCRSCGRQPCDGVFCQPCGGDYSRVPGDGISNAATRLNDLIVAEWSVGRHPTERFAADYVREDRRRFLAMPDADKDSFRDVLEEIFALGGRVARNRPLAVRGERFSLAQGPIEYDGGRSVVDYLVIQVVDQSLEQVQRHVLFDENDFELAYRELDRLWLASLPAETASMIRTSLDDAHR